MQREALHRALTGHTRTKQSKAAAYPPLLLLNAKGLSLFGHPNKNLETEIVPGSEASIISSWRVAAVRNKQYLGMSSLRSVLSSRMSSSAARGKPDLKMCYMPQLPTS